MKVYQFIKKFLWNSSSIKRVILCDYEGNEILLTKEDLYDPDNKESKYYERLRSKLNSFRICNGNLTIYHD